MHKSIQPKPTTILGSNQDRNKTPDMSPTREPFQYELLHHLQMVDESKSIISIALKRHGTACFGPKRGLKLSTVRLAPVRLMRMVTAEVRIHLPIDLRLHQHHPQ